ncbi:unnamed protein product [Nippostrongylus brasiliensis]|uniref:Transmembrane protein 144 (inferred by orthology to a human protein) n=1 Tax=Nippostrongylus brasiliensis TaxID=27835 RepID=A0A0N4XZZ1_NIPBR|nr:unnamed protein product [Nippostrongylus brasiliensis]
MEQDVIVGIGATIVSAFTYGSTYVPVRWFEAGDGLFFQWMMCIGQMLFGTITLASTGFPPVHPLAMLAGTFFATGNALTVYIMDGIGMAVGALLWNSTTCIVGWAVTRFGLFGNPQQLPSNNVLNIIGVVMICIAGCFFATIKHHRIRVRPAPWQEKRLRHHTFTVFSSTLLTFFVGFLYGNMLTPINYLVANSAETGNPTNVSSYFFSFSFGALLTSTVIFMTIAYPILSKAPGVVASLWAVFLFKEIKGFRDLATLTVGICVTLTGVALVSISKIRF